MLKEFELFIFWTFYCQADGHVLNELNNSISCWRVGAPLSNFMDN